jgi:CheY-like chemotaxis protein
MNMGKTVNVLWHDDHSISDDDRKDYLSKWDDWFTKEAPRQGLSVELTGTLAQLSDKLVREQPVFDLLILDVKLTLEPESNFGALGFENEGVLGLQAGIQIVGLMRNRMFENGCKPWLRRYRDTPIILLSTSEMLEPLFKQGIDADRRSNIFQVRKSVDLSGSADEDEMAFETAMQMVLAHLRKLKSQS